MLDEVLHAVGMAPPPEAPWRAAASILFRRAGRDGGEPLFAATNFSLSTLNLAWVARGDPGEALRVADEAMQEFAPDRTMLHHFWSLIALVNAHLRAAARDARALGRIPMTGARATEATIRASVAAARGDTEQALADRTNELEVSVRGIRGAAGATSPSSAATNEAGSQGPSIAATQPSCLRTRIARPRRRARGYAEKRTGSGRGGSARALRRISP